MVFNFEKYEGAGNDFVVIDDRDMRFDVQNHKAVQHLCDRHFGIGADGLILLRNHSYLDFEMVYFNADGNVGSMCGNGGRCIAAFAKKIGAMGNEAVFLASDGPHKVFFERAVPVLKMQDIDKIESIGEHYFLDTGSPHYIVFNNDPARIDLLREARKIRYNERFKANGTNVNFISWNGELHIRTYERGVEDETLACGTGITAAALVVHHAGLTSENKVKVKAAGGELEVRFRKTEAGAYTDIWLAGPAAYVYKGEFEVKV